MSIRQRHIPLSVLVLLCIHRFAAAQNAAPAASAVEQQIDQAIARMVTETEDLEPKKNAQIHPIFTRPHPLLAGVNPAEAAPVLLDRMLKKHTDNPYKENYIRFHLMYPLLDAGPEELKKYRDELDRVSKNLPEVPTLEGREEYTYEPLEVGLKWREIYYRCRRWVGIPPFERYIDPPDSFAYMSNKERQELEPLWEEAKRLKFKTINDMQAYVWNRRIGMIHHCFRLYEAEVLCARLAAGDESVLDDVLGIIGRSIDSKPGVAADYIAYVSLAYMNGYLEKIDPDELKSFARSLKSGAAANTEWFNHQGRWRNIPETAFHLVNALESERPAPIWSEENRPAATSPPRSAAISADQLQLASIHSAIDRAAYALSRVPRPELFLTWESYKVIGLVPEVYPPDLIQAGHQALGAWGLLAAGESHQSIWMQKRINWSMLHETPTTYDRAMRMQMLSLLPRAEWRDWYSRDVRGLLAAMTDEGGFVAEVHKNPPTGFGDNANSQYAIMALASAERAGQEIPMEAWRRMDNYWRAGQGKPEKLPTGEFTAGWAIRSFASLGEGEQAGDFTTRVNGPMTAAGVMALSITERMLAKAKRSEASQSMSKHFQAGVKWLDTNFALDTVDADQDFYYYMWTIQNVGQATGYRTFNNIDWFRAATAKLLNQQQPSGLWSGPKGDTVSTSFALLYLYRAGGPLAICKVRWVPPADPKKKYAKPPVESWNNRPSDLYNLTGYISDAFETPTSWQIADLDQPVHELIETPILWLSTDKPYEFDEAQQRAFRDYIQAGGLLVCNPEGRSPMPVVNSMKTLAKSLFPDIEPRKVDAEGPVYSLFQKIQPAIPMIEIHNGVRPLMYISERDLGKELQGGLEKERDAFNVLSNIYLFASGREPRRPRLDLNYVVTMPRTTNEQLPVARLLPAGQVDAEPGAMSQLAAMLANQHGIKLTYDTISPAAIGSQKVAFLSVAATTDLTDAEAAAMNKWVQNGNVLWIDAVGGSLDAAARVNLLVEKIGVKNESLSPLPAEHVILSGTGLTGGHDNRAFKLRTFTHAPRGRGEAQIKTAPLGTGTLYVCTEDLTCGLAGLNHWGIQGYTPLFARQLVANSVLDLMKQKK